VRQTREAIGKKERKKKKEKKRTRKGTTLVQEIISRLQAPRSNVTDASDSFIYFS